MKKEQVEQHIFTQLKTYIGILKKLRSLQFSDDSYALRAEIQ